MFLCVCVDESFYYTFSNRSDANPVLRVDIKGLKNIVDERVRGRLLDMTATQLSGPAPSPLLPPDWLGCFVRVPTTFL